MRAIDRDKKAWTTRFDERKGGESKGGGAVRHQVSGTRPGTITVVAYFTRELLLATAARAAPAVAVVGYAVLRVYKYVRT